MGIRVGVPVLKLSAAGQATKRKGNTRKVAMEAGNERYSKDQDLDRSRSHLNEYTGFTSGKALADYWETEAAKHTDALGRSLKSTAITGFSVIFKPDMDSMQQLGDQERLQFIRDGVQVTKTLLQEAGLQVDMTALHRDEMVDHCHILGHDPEYKAAKKLDIRLFAQLNRELPKRLRAMGYDVEDTAVYDPAKVASMSEEEQAVYKADLIERKKSKKSGQSSNAYKAEKLNEQEKALQEQAAALDIERRQLEAQRVAQEARQRAQDAREADLNRRAKEDKAEREKWQETANKSLAKRQNELQAEYESKYQEIKKAYDRVKNTYTAAEVQASGIAKGYSVDNFQKFGQRVQQLVLQKCQNQRFSNGKTMADYVAAPLAESIRQTIQETPDPHLQAQRDRVKKADRALPDIPDWHQKSDNEYGY